MKLKIILIQTFIILIGIAAITFLLWEPHLEGRNVNASLLQIYFNDPFLAFVYFASIPFFMVLYQAFKVLELAGKNNLISKETLKRLRLIKNYAISIIAFTVIGVIIIFLNESDDRTGGVFMGMLVIITSILIAISVSNFERNLKNRLNENCNIDSAE
ncbi:MAG TPA: DUF2975 domain-containing protein [Bacteroidetes bacterium]|nr:DUF2975 domain-containing protein [Bacteroidota bacterium]HRI46005.1 DUF2975 domain-containing protein [Ignavibacteriaceae bacterium]